jgi:histidine ammonia-lyase
LFFLICCISEPLEAVHRLVRTVVAPWDSDRYMAPDIEAAVQLLRDNRVWEAALPWFHEDDVATVRASSPASTSASAQQ